MWSYTMDLWQFLVARLVLNALHLCGNAVCIPFEHLLRVQWPS